MARKRKRVVHHKVSHREYRKYHERQSDASKPFRYETQLLIDTFLLKNQVRVLLESLKALAFKLDGCYMFEVTIKKLG